MRRKLTVMLEEALASSQGCGQDRHHIRSIAIRSFVLVSRYLMKSRASFGFFACDSAPKPRCSGSPSTYRSRVQCSRYRKWRGSQCLVSELVSQTCRQSHSTHFSLDVRGDARAAPEYARDERSRGTHLLRSPARPAAPASLRPISCAIRRWQPQVQVQVGFGAGGSSGGALVSVVSGYCQQISPPSAAISVPVRHWVVHHHLPEHDQYNEHLESNSLGHGACHQ